MIKKIIKRIFIRPSVKDLCLIFIFCLFPILWFGKNEILLGHDLGFPLDPIGWFLDRIWMWGNKGGSFGGDSSGFAGVLPIHALEALLSQLGFSIFTVQKLTLIFWNMAMSFSMYYFLGKFFHDEKFRWFRIFASILSIFNFFILTRFIVFERTGFSMMVSIPLSLGIIAQYLQKKCSLQKTLAILFFVFLFFNAGGIPPFVGILFLCIIVFFLWHIFFEVRSKEAVQKTLLIFFGTLISFILANLYWILPMWNSNREIFQNYVSQNAGNILSWIDAVSSSANITNLLRLEGTNEWHASGSEFYASFFLQSKIGIFLSFLLPILAWSSLLLARKKQEILFLSFTTILALIFIFLSGGSHPPLGKYFSEFIQTVPYASIYRTPIYKFLYVVSFSYAILIAYTLAKIKNFVDEKFFLFEKIFRKKNVFSFITGSIFMLAIIGFNFIYFHPNLFYLWDSFSIKVSIPKEILEARDFMRGESIDSRVLLLPRLNPKFGGIDTYNWGYWSITPLSRLAFPQMIIADHDAETAKKEIHELYNAMENDNREKMISLFKRFNIDYILFRKDVVYPEYFRADFSSIQTNLENNSDILEKKGVFGAWEIFKIRVPSEIVEITRVPQFLSPTIHAQKQNNARYKIFVENASVPFDLILKNNFHSGWKLFYKEEETLRWKKLFSKLPLFDAWFLPLKEEKEHFKAFQFANAWHIDPPSKNFELMIEYWPQRLWFFGIAISSISFFIASAILLFSFWRGWKKSHLP